MFEPEEDAEDVLVGASALDDKLGKVHGQLVEPRLEQGAQPPEADGWGLQLEVALEGKVVLGPTLPAQDAVDEGMVPRMRRELAEVSDPGVFGAERSVHFLQLEAHRFLEVDHDLGPVSEENKKDA